MVIKTILFDLDDTLYDYESTHKKSMNEVYTFLKKEINMTRKKFLKLFEQSKEEIKMELSGTASSHNRVLYFQRLVEKIHGTLEANLIKKLYRTYWDYFIKEMNIGNGVLETLRELKKRNLKIVLVSDMTTYVQLRKIIKLKINKYLDYLVTSEETESEKPHSIMFLLALKKANCLPSEAIMIGDSRNKDIAGANAGGIKTIWITNSKNLPSEKGYKKPEYIIKKIPELLNIIDKLNDKEAKDEN